MKIFNIITIFSFLDSCRSLSLRNGGVHMSYLRKDGKWHAKATFLCFYGFNRYGAYSAICETSGDWSEDAPLCDGMYH